MGTLDEAIREHLELRRLRGVDRDELARDEQAALGPPGDELAEGPADERWARTAASPAPAGVAVAVREQQEALYASQETAELDMSTVFDIESTSATTPDRADGEAQRDTASLASSGIGHGASSLETELDRLDWEVSRTRPLAGRVRRGSDLDP
jgi:hypothetical protein